MKKLMLIAALGAAAIFTACGDDSSSNSGSNGGNSSKTKLDGKTVVSCNEVSTIAGIESRSCHAIAADDAGVDAFKEKCAPIGEGDTRQFTIGEGCTDALLACDTPEGQVEYFYDDASAHVGCGMVSPHSL